MPDVLNMAEFYGLALIFTGICIAVYLLTLDSLALPNPLCLFQPGLLKDHGQS